MPTLALAGAFLLIAGAATWAGGAVVAKTATRQIFTWAGVEHAVIDALELSVVAGAAVLLPWVVSLAAYAAWWKGGGAGGGSGGGGGSNGGRSADSGVLLMAALQALAVSTLLFTATVAWTADMGAARDRLGGGPSHHPDPAGGGGRPWGPPPPAPVGDPTPPPTPGAGPLCPDQCLDISAVVKVFKLPLPPCFCGQQWLLRDLYVHMDDAIRALAAATSGASACWIGSVALVLWAAEERVRAVGGIFAAAV
jgi:hypothetical protein